MELKELFQTSLAYINDIVNQIKAGQWDNTTTCAPWDLKQLLNHVTYEWLWAPELFVGKTVAEVGDKFEGDVLGMDPIESYQKAAKTMHAAVAKLDLSRTVHLSYADVPASEYLFQLSIEALIHGWDIAKAIEYGTQLPSEPVKALYKLVQKYQKELTGSGYYGQAFKTNPNVDPQTKLLALLGRKG